MSRRSLVVRQADVKRAIRGAKAAGVEIARVDIEAATGRISIIPKGAAEAEDPDNLLNEWLAKKNARASQGN